MSKQPLFSGAICPSITPFTLNGKIDFSAMEKHYARLTNSGINGILLMGTIGEFPTLSIEERITIIKEAHKMTSLPIIVHVSTTVIDDMVRLADTAFNTGYKAVMALPHYYYAQSVNQLFAYYSHLDSRFAGDWMIYNFPVRTGCDVDAPLVAKLIKQFPKFIGIKDTVDAASHNREIAKTALSLREGFSVFAGFDEYLVPNLMNGGTGIISGLNNVVPEIFAQVMQAYKNNNLTEVAALQKEICRLSSIYAIGDDFVTTIKTAVARKFGYMNSNSRNFGGALNTEQLKKIDTLFAI